MQRSMIRKMQKKMQQSIQKMQEDLGSQEVQGIAGGGAVTVTMDGHMALKSIKLDPSVVDPEEVEMLEDLIMVAFKDAMSNIQAQQAQVMSQMAGGLNIPPDLLGL